MCLSPPRSWPSVEARLRAGVDVALAEEAIRVQASQARTFFEAVLWPGWAAAVLADRPADVEREALRTMADAFLRLTGDSLYRDAVTAVDRAGRQGSVALRDLAAAHAAYADAASLARQDLFSAASPKLLAARAQLEAARSPFAVRADLDLAGSYYYGRKTAETSELATRILDVSRAAGYRNLESRATWLQGLVAFGEGRYGDARAAWEQMLAAAEQGADVEQQAAAHGLLANLLDYLGDSEPAWRHRRVALAAMEASGATRLRYGLLLSTAGQALKEHDPAAALALQDAVVETAMQSKRPAAIAEALAARASIHAALGLIQKATDDLAATRSEILAMPDAALRARIEGTCAGGGRQPAQGHEQLQGHRGGGARHPVVRRPEGNGSTASSLPGSRRGVAGARRICTGAARRLDRHLHLRARTGGSSRDRRGREPMRDGSCTKWGCARRSAKAICRRRSPTAIGPGHAASGRPVARPPILQLCRRVSARPTRFWR